MGYTEHGKRRTDAGAVDPWIVQVALSTLDQEDLEFVVQIGQPWEVLSYCID